MKKAATFLVAATLLCTFAFISAGRVDFSDRNDDCLINEQVFGDNQTDAWLVFRPPRGKQPNGMTELRIQVSNAYPDWGYLVIVGEGESGSELGTVWTDGSGRGSVNLSLSPSELGDGDVLGLWSEFPSGGFGCWQVRTPPYSQW